MHIITPCILILVTIYGNIIVDGTEIDITIVTKIIDDLGEMFDEYYEDKLLNENLSSILSSVVNCDDQNINNCYTTLLSKYNNELLPKIGNVFNGTILRLLNEYNILVMNLLSKYSEETNEADFAVIQFENSKAYCLIGFLSIININLNDKLNDFIFFTQLKQIKEKKHAPIKSIVIDHFHNRIDELYKKVANVHKDNIPLYYILKADGKEITNQISDLKEITNRLSDLKEIINKYSEPFCGIDFPWMKADSWIWTKLETSPILSKSFGENVNQATSPSLLEWQDIKVNFKHSTDPADGKYKYNYNRSPSVNVLLEDFNERCKDLFLYSLEHSSPQETIPEVTEDMKAQLQYNFESVEDKFNKPSNSIQIVEMDNKDDKVVSPHEQNSLKTIFQNEYGAVKFDDIETFYLTISHSIDAYVTKVLFHRVLDRLAYSLERYQGFLEDYKQVIENQDTPIKLANMITEFLYLADQFTAFQVTWELYTNSKPLTLGGYAILDGHKILNYVRFEYMYSVVKFNVLPDTIDKIKRHLKDVRFQKLNENRSISSESDEKWINPTQEITEINIILSKLVEIKRQI